jgi:uncharacterized membrane protein YhaH (DUF805 family)
VAYQAEFKTDEIVCILLSVTLVAILIKPLQVVDMMGWWWFSFIIFNLCYVVHGLKKGWIKGDPANAMVIVSGPIAFYFWTFVKVWRRYGKRKLLKRENSEQRKEVYEEKVGISRKSSHQQDL